MLEHLSAPPAESIAESVRALSRRNTPTKQQKGVPRWSLRAHRLYQEVEDELVRRDDGAYHRDQLALRARFKAIHRGRKPKKWQLARHARKSAVGAACRTAHATLVRKLGREPTPEEFTEELCANPVMREAVRWEMSLELTAALRSLILGAESIRDLQENSPLGRQIRNSARVAPKQWRDLMRFLEDRREQLRK